MTMYSQLGPQDKAVLLDPHYNYFFRASVSPVLRYDVFSPLTSKCPSLFLPLYGVALWFCLMPCLLLNLTEHQPLCSICHFLQVLFAEVLALPASLPS